LAAALASRGQRVSAIALDGAEGLEPYSTRDSASGPVALTRMAYRYQDHRALADVVESPRAEEVLRRWAEARALDLVHVHHLSGWGLGALRALRAAGAGLVMTLHDYWTLCPRGQMLRADGAVCARAEAATCGECLARTWPHLVPSRSGERRGPSGAPVASDAEACDARTDFALEMLALPQRLLVPSTAALDVFVRNRVPRARVTVVQNGIDVAGLAAEVRRLRSEAPRARGELRLGVLGTVLPSKGALELALAFREADVPGLALEIHGALPSYHGDPSYVENLRRVAAGDARIRLHGPYARAELARILAGLDAVAAPSRWAEVFGLTVREARAAGLPILVSDAGDLPRAAGGGAAGIVVPAEDRAAWVAALRRFAGDPAFRARLAAAEVPLCTVAQMTDEIESVYRAVARQLGLPRRAGARTDSAGPTGSTGAPSRRGLFGALLRGLGRPVEDPSGGGERPGPPR
jgi:glycosyltransferase involved in cell wall biosynthesis